MNRSGRLADFFGFVANVVVWIMAALNAALMIVGAVAVIVADVFFTSQVLGKSFGGVIGLVFSLAITGMLVGTQVVIGFGEDRNMGQAWREAGKWQKTAFGLSFIVRALDALLATYYVDLYMVALPTAEVDGMVYWLTKGLVFTLDFAGELIAPAALIALSKWNVRD